MSLYTIGDLHLSFSVDKPMDIFHGWQDYAERLEKNWNNIVTDDDTVVIPGDISWAMSLEEAKSDFEFIEKLKGKKIILKGNHDYWWNTMSKMNMFIEENGFSSVKILFNNAYEVDGYAVAGTRGWFCDDSDNPDKKIIMREAGRLELSLKCAEKLSDNVIVFLHYPPVSSTMKCDEILSVLKSHNIKRCFFGHLHGFVPPENAHLFYDGIEFSLVSADKLLFCPKRIYD